MIVIAIDQHNVLITGGVSMTLLSGRTDGHSVPVIMVKEDDISEGDRTAHGEQPSGIVLRTGRIYGYACDGEQK